MDDDGAYSDMDIPSDMDDPQVDITPCGIDADPDDDEWGPWTADGLHLDLSGGPDAV